MVTPLTEASETHLSSGRRPRAGPARSVLDAVTDPDLTPPTASSRWSLTPASPNARRGRCGHPPPRGLGRSVFDVVSAYDQARRRAFSRWSPTTLGALDERSGEGNPRQSPRASTRAPARGLGRAFWRGHPPGRFLRQPPPKTTRAGEPPGGSVVENPAFRPKSAPSFFFREARNRRQGPTEGETSAGPRPPPPPSMPPSLL
jgi:hypothetical protein